jgi:hypothetical protein
MPSWSQPTSTVSIDKAASVMGRRMAGQGICQDYRHDTPAT